MILDVELSEEDISNLKKGGFFILYLFDGIKVTINKDKTHNIQEEN